MRAAVIDILIDDETGLTHLLLADGQLVLAFPAQPSDDDSRMALAAAEDLED